MQAIIDKLLGGTPKGKLRTIKAIRPNVQIITAAGDRLTSVVGESYIVSEKDAAGLVHYGDAEWLPNEEQQKEIARVQNLIPPPTEPREAPKILADLPECFAELWSITERLRCLKTRQVAIEAVLLRGYKLRDSEIAHLRQDTNHPSPAALRSELIDAWVSRQGLNIQFSQRDLAEVAKVRDAMERIGNDIDQFREDNRKRILTLQYECSAHTISEHDRAKELADELAETAFDIFAVRVGALGLGEHKIRSLFLGSADANNYMVSKPSISDVKLFGIDDEGQPIHMIDKPADVMAQMFKASHEKAEAYAKLLKTAKAELRKAKSAAAPEVALPS